VAAIRCISLWQPWASLVACGAKTIETRNRPAPRTIIGARIGIHAAKSKKGFHWLIVSPELAKACEERGFLTSADFPLGHIVATAVVEASIPTAKLEGDIFGNYAPDRYGWMLCDVRPLTKPIPWKGSQGIFFADLP
jgi:hypothetical protein